MKKVFSDPAGNAGFPVPKRRINVPVNEIKTAGEYTVDIELRQVQGKLQKDFANKKTSKSEFARAKPGLVTYLNFRNFPGFAKNDQAEGDSHVQPRDVYECIRQRS